jgi:hypothetical protein
MVVADDPRNFPCAVFVLPEMNEFAFTDALGFLMSRVVETMDAHLDCAIALHVIHLQSPWNEFAGRFAADILLDAVGQCGLAEGETTLIVVKLDIIDKEGTELLQIAAVVGVEEGGIERGDGLVQFGLGIDVLERRDRLSAGPDTADGEYREQQQRFCNEGFLHETPFSDGVQDARIYVMQGEEVPSGSTDSAPHAKIWATAAFRASRRALSGLGFELLREVPLMAFGILGAIAACAVRRVCGLCEDLGPGLFGACKMFVNIVDVDVEALG